eukprot:14967219-Alexandrium_andersonii.AAC.1
MVHAWVSDAHVEAAPVCARGAPHEEVGTLRAQQADGMLAAICPVDVPGLPTGTWAEVEGPSR